MNFYREIGKHPIHVRKEVRGHAANRLQVALWREAIHLVVEGVVSVADADAAIAYGPGLRWALMGPHLTFHMAGGDGGMKHYLDHLGPANQSWMDDLGAPRLDAKTQKAIIDGVTDEAAGRSMDDLRRWRAGATVWSETSSVRSACETADTALAKASAFACDGLLKPESLRTN